MASVITVTSGAGIQRILAVSCLVVAILHCATAFVLPLPIEVGTDVEFDLSLTLPYTVIFPDVFGRRKRAASDRGHPSTSPVNSVQEVIVAKLESIFLAVGVNEEACQERLFCAVHRDPDKYSPLSDVILQHMDVRLDAPASEVGMTKENNPSARYFQLRVAAREGLSGDNGDCVRITPRCNNDPDNQLDWRLFNFLKIVKTYFGIKFK